MKNITDFTGRLGNQMFEYAYLYAQTRKGIIPDIFVQDEAYFSEYKDDISQLFGNGIGNIPAVALHVRRGDYVNNPFYIDLMEDGYYERALQEFPNESFLVFSDDIAWCKKQELFKDFLFSEETTDVEALNAMASCEGHIIANSSFSWWAAYLSPHGGKVVAPKKWYADGVERTSIPASWKRV